MGFFDWLFSSRKIKRKSNRVKIIDPDGLFYKDGVCRGYRRLKRTYGRHQLSNYINGKRVRFWKIVYGADDADRDEFIPIYYNIRRRRR